MAIWLTSLISILVFIVFMLVTPSSAAHTITDNEIKDLCSKTSYPDGCNKLLKADHHTANADARGLAEISVDFASRKASKIHSMVDSLAKGTHNFEWRNIFRICLKNYQDTIRDLEVAKNYIQSGAYKNAPLQVKDASEESKNCEKVFDKVSSDRAHVKKNLEDFKFLISIVNVMSDNLNKNYIQSHVH